METLSYCQLMERCIALAAENAGLNEKMNKLATVLALLDELEAAEKRIAELQAREVKLPDVEKWRSPEAVRAQNAYRLLVGQEISAAGIITKVGE